MNTKCIATTLRTTMRPLSFQGIYATDCYGQLSRLLEGKKDFLAEHGMPDAGTFLAEPMHDPSTGRIDWYVPESNTPARPFSTLSPEEQEGVYATLQRYSSALTALAETDGNNKAVQLLCLAMQHPSQDDLWLLGDKPLLINWGFRPGNEQAEPEDILRMSPFAPPPPSKPASVTPPSPSAPSAAAATTAVPPKRFGCLPWLLPLLLLALLIWLLLAALGYLPSPFPASCSRIPDSADYASEELRKRSLEDEEKALLEQLAQRAALCKPTAKKEDPIIEERKPVIPPIKEEKVAQKDEQLAIPDDAQENNDLSFLQGCWNSVTNLRNSRTGEPVVVEYCFDKHGNGKRIQHEKNGDRCEGKAKASFTKDSLKIQADEAHCKKVQSTYVAQQVECTGTGETTQCFGKEPTAKDPNHSWNATFKHK